MKLSIVGSGFIVREVLPHRKDAGVYFPADSL